MVALVARAGVGPFGLGPKAGEGGVSVRLASVGLVAKGFRAWLSEPWVLPVTVP